MPRGTGMSTTRRRKRTRPSAQAAFGVIDLLRSRLSASANAGTEAPWTESDEQRFQKQFDRPSPQSHKAIPTNQENFSCPPTPQPATSKPSSARS
jgi:hypothetical protein